MPLREVRRRSAARRDGWPRAIARREGFDDLAGAASMDLTPGRR
jgi:hypothetical protein